MAESLVFELQPRGEALTFRGLIEATESINRILRDVDYTITGNKTAHQWLVTRLSNPTPSLTLQPILDEVGLVDLTARGLESITADEAPTAPPEGWSEYALDDLRRTKRLFNGYYDMRAIVVKRNAQPIARIADDISRKVDRVYRGGYSLLGSLEGKLEAVNLHGKTPTTTIWERMSGRPVRVHLSQELKSKAKDLLEHRVLVSGRIKYFANGASRSIVDLKDIRDLDRPYRLRAEFGSIPDITGDLTTEEFLEAMRE